MKWIRNLLLFLLFILLVLGLPLCTSPEQTEEEDTISTTLDSSEATTSSEIKTDPLAEEKTDPAFDNLARFLAGLPPAQGSALDSLAQTAVWQQYAQVADQQWKQVNQAKLPPMQQWQSEELSEVNQATRLVFYPFSGPDFLHAGMFFPEAQTYVMVGLEPIGNLPDMQVVARKSLGAYTNGLQQTLYTILNWSFFRTISMAQDFTGKRVAEIDGTLPILMLFLTRTDHKILYYEKIAVSPEGKLIPAEQAPSDSTYYGTKIDFQRNDHPEERKTLYYFAANLQDTPYSARSGLSEGGLQQRSDFRNYLESLDIDATYLKSASYLMYRETFSIIRNLILEKSEYVLQDDSGIPVKYFSEEAWNRTFYGTYVGPIALFKVRYQSDLRSIYQDRQNVKPLPFGIGYKYQPGTSNLMLAEKK